MIENVITMIGSASIIVLAVIGVATIYPRFAGRPMLRAALLGILFLLTGCVVMENSVEVVPGIRTDPRAAVITLSAAIGGPLSVAITASGLAVLRLAYGGAGAVPGATYIIVVGLVAALARAWWFRRPGRELDFRYILLQSCIAGLVPTLTLLVVSTAPWGVFLTANALFAPTNFLASIGMGTMVLRDLERQAAMSARREAQAQIDAIADNAPVVLFQMVDGTDGAPRFTYVSKTSERMLGLAPDTLLARFDALGTVASDEAMQALERALRGSRDTGWPWSTEMACTRPCGSVAWVRLDAGIRVDQGGRTVWDGSISDITERRRAEQLKDEFVSTVSHELRTPLTSIRGSLGLIAGTAAGTLPEPVLKMLEIANRNAERLVLLVNDILDMQKIQSGHMRIVLERTAVRPLLNHALASTQSYAPDKELRFSLTDDTQDAEIDVDPERLGQILANLLSNAAKFSPKGGLIGLSVAFAGPNVRISVSDEGPGIPESFRGRVFERFAQAETSSTRSTGGTGLGLSISKVLAEAMDGSLSFETARGRGTVFHLDLPAPVPAAPAAPRAGPSGPIRPSRILMCTRDTRIAGLAGPDPDGAHRRIDVASDIDVIRVLAGARDYDGIVVDMDGCAASTLHDLRRDPRTRDLPIVVISRDGPDGPGGAPEIVDRLAKPVTRARLDDALRALDAVPGSGRPPTVLYVEDDPHLQEIIGQSLGDAVRISPAPTLGQARERIAEGGVDLVLLDLDLPDGDGLALLAEIADHVPVVIFSAYEVEPEIGRRAARVMTKSRVEGPEVVRAILDALSGPLAPDPRAAA